jgi:hypothetical protein
MKNKYFNSIDTECSTDENFEVKGEKNICEAKESAEKTYQNYIKLLMSWE